MGCGASHKKPEETGPIQNIPRRSIIQVRPVYTDKSVSTDDAFQTHGNKPQKMTATVQPSKITHADKEPERKELIAATEGEDITRLEKAIGNFQQRGLLDKGDLTRARNKLVKLHLQNLRRATLGRKLEDLDEAIDSAHNSYVASELLDSEELEDAEKTRSQLGRLKLYLHKVLQLNRATIAEMHSYQRPRPLVHQVMKATFRILGEPNSRVQDWAYLQALMRQLGPGSMLARMQRCDVVNLKQRQVSDAECYLGETRKHLVRMCSAGAGTFYVWSNNMISEYYGTNEDSIGTARTNTTNYNTHREQNTRRSKNMSNGYTSSKIENPRNRSKSRN